MFWGCFSIQGPGTLRPVDGMMNSDKYINVLQHKLVPEMMKIFPNNDGIFQQDLTPCHTSKKVTKYMTDNNITTLAWPGNSPDLNPIENLWSIIKTRLRNRDCTQKTKLIESIIDVWLHDVEVKTVPDAYSFYAKPCFITHTC